MLAMYSPNEIKLFKAFGLFDILHYQEPLIVYRTAIDIVFRYNWEGPHVEALRKGYIAFCENKPLRNTDEFELLIAFELPDNLAAIVRVVN